MRKSKDYKDGALVTAKTPDGTFVVFIYAQLDGKLRLVGANPECPVRCYLPKDVQILGVSDATRKAGDRPEPAPLTGDEIRALASIIVYPADSQPVYSADETALALIRLVAGVAATVAAGDSNITTAADVAYFVTLGAFNNTNAHGAASAMKRCDSTSTGLS
jgi:hypothetical protein